MRSKLPSQLWWSRSLVSLSALPLNFEWRFPITRSLLTSSPSAQCHSSSRNRFNLRYRRCCCRRVCIIEKIVYGGGAQDGRRQTRSPTRGIYNTSKRNWWCCCEETKKYSAGACTKAALKNQPSKVVRQQKKWGGDEPHFQLQVVCSRAWPEKAKMLALTNRSICGQDPGWSWWLRLRLFRGLKVAPPTVNIIINRAASAAAVVGASCWAKERVVMTQHRVHYPI